MLDDGRLLLAIQEEDNKLMNVTTVVGRHSFLPWS